MSRASDLVIVGQPDPSPADPATIPYGTDVLPQELALQAGRPVMTLPHTGPMAEAGRRILVAWHAQRERSAEARVGNECVSTCRSTWVQCHAKTKNNNTQYPYALIRA